MMRALIATLLACVLGGCSVGAARVPPPDSPLSGDDGAAPAAGGQAAPPVAPPGDPPATRDPSVVFPAPLPTAVPPWSSVPGDEGAMRYRGATAYQAAPEFQLTFDPAVWALTPAAPGEPEGYPALVHRTLPACTLRLRTGPRGASPVGAIWLAGRRWAVSHFGPGPADVAYSTPLGDHAAIFGLNVPLDAVVPDACHLAAEALIDTYAVLDAQGDGMTVLSADVQTKPDLAPFDPGDASGWPVLRAGSLEVRYPPAWSVTSPAADLATARNLTLQGTLPGGQADHYLVESAILVQASPYGGQASLAAWADTLPPSERGLAVVGRGPQTVDGQEAYFVKAEGVGGGSVAETFYATYIRCGSDVWAITAYTTLTGGNLDELATIYRTIIQSFRCHA